MIDSKQDKEEKNKIYYLVNAINEIWEWKMNLKWELGLKHLEN